MDKYIKPIYEFLKNNDWSSEESKFILLQYEIVDKMKIDNIGNEAIQPIIELMEKHPLVEFGTPGPLTHFIESYYNANRTFYEKLLIQSIKNNPAVHTIWLLNRLINSSNQEKKEEYLQILKSIYNNKTLHNDIHVVSKNFLEYQKKL